MTDAIALCTYRPTHAESQDIEAGNAPSKAEIATQADRYWRAHLAGASGHPADSAIDDTAVWVIADSPHVDALIRLLHGCSLPEDAGAIAELRAKVEAAVLRDLSSRIDEGAL